MNEKYLNDLKEIKDIMNRSSRFISLSGLSGVSAGVVALIGAYMANEKIYTLELLNDDRVFLSRESLTQLLSIAIGTLVVAISTGIFFTTRKTLKAKQKIWDHQTQRLLINLAIPLAAGGALCLMLLVKGYVGLLMPMTLIFYGLALVNASKYTLTELRSLGLLEILLGLLSIQFIDLALLLWALGFGVLHIVYGIYMVLKYKS